MLKFFSSNFGGRNFDALRYFWKKPTNGIFENGQKSTSEAEKSFLEADFDFFWTKILFWSENTQKSSFALFFTLISSKMADLAQKMFSSFFGFLTIFRTHNFCSKISKSLFRLKNVPYDGFGRTRPLECVYKPYFIVFDHF